MAHTYSGTGVALVTPFSASGTIDEAALRRIVDSVIDGGVDYVVALGTTAETPTLTTEEKKQVLAIIVDQVAERVPVVCGMGGNNTQEILQQMQEFDLGGVSALLSVVPYYNKPTQEGLYRHFKVLAELSPLPIILYNVPGRTVTNMAAETTLRLAHDFQNIVAVKEASGNLKQCMELVAGKPDHFAVLSGDDDLVLPQISIGMDGVISVAANCFTRDFTMMVNSALQGNYETARQLHYQLLPGTELLFTEGNPAGVKAVLHQQGLCENTLRLPLIPVSDALAERIVGYMGAKVEG